MPPRNNTLKYFLVSSPLEDGEFEHTLKPNVMLYEIVSLKSNPFPSMVNGGLKYSFHSPAVTGVPRCPALSWSQDTQKRRISARSLLKFTPKLPSLNSLGLDIFSCFSVGHRCAAFYLNLSKRQTFQCQGKKWWDEKRRKKESQDQSLHFFPSCEKQTTSFPAVTGKHSENFTKRSLFPLLKKKKKKQGHLVVISNNQICLNIPVLLKIPHQQIEVIKRSAVGVLKNVRLGRCKFPSWWGPPRRTCSFWR